MQNNGAAVEAYVTPRTISPRRKSAPPTDLPKPPLGKMEVVRWKSGDGMEIEGILNTRSITKPASASPCCWSFTAARPGSSPRTSPPAQASIRPQSSTPAVMPCCRPTRAARPGTAKFRYANTRIGAAAITRDLMAGVDHVISTGVADPDRLGVMGWSYGGFMTSWVITQTKRFKAASIGAAVTNLMSFTGTADIPGFIPDYMGAQFWDNLDVYRQHSAMFNIKGASTSLIQHCEGDLRVPISQGYELYNALKQQGVPAHAGNAPGPRPDRTEDAAEDHANQRRVVRQDDRRRVIDEAFEKIAPNIVGAGFPRHCL